MTAPSHDVGLAAALPTLGLALSAERALWVAEAGCGQDTVSTGHQHGVWGVQGHTHAVPRRAGWLRGCAGVGSRAQPPVTSPQCGNAERSGTARRSPDVPWQQGHPQ